MRKTTNSSPYEISNKPNWLLRLTLLFMAVLCVTVFISTMIPESSTDDTLTEPTQPTETAPIETTTPTEPTEPPTEPTTEPTEPPTEPPKYFDVPLSNDLQDWIFELCGRNDVDPAIIIAMIKKESNYNPGSIGDNGNSIGLMQIQPRWHQALMDSIGVSDLLDPYQNVHTGICLFSTYYIESGSVEHALMRYNGGRGMADKMTAEGKVTPYVTKVFEIMESLERRH